MILLTQDGYQIEWEDRLDRESRNELARWRDSPPSNGTTPANCRS